MSQPAVSTPDYKEHHSTCRATYRDKTSVSRPEFHTSTSSSGPLKRPRSVSENSDENTDGGGDGGGFKRRRQHHANRVQCLPCVLWKQSGSDPNLQHLHPLKDSTHVGSNVVPLSQYTSYGSTIFHLTSDDCVCKPCYVDFQRRYNTENRYVYS